MLPSFLFKVYNFISSCCSSLISSFSPSSIFPLELFNLFFLLLCFIQQILWKFSWVSSFNAITGQSFFFFFISIWMIYQVYFSGVKPSFSVEVNVAAIISRNLICNLSFSNYLTLKILLRLLFNLAYIIPSIDFILGISEFNFTVNPLVQSSHHCVVESIGRVVKFDCLAILEYYCFMACWGAHSWVKICFYAVLIPAVNCVFIIRSFDVKWWSWRMMASLFTKHFTSVCGKGLISFS